MKVVSGNSFNGQQPLSRQLMFVVLGALCVLMVPLVAMQFTAEVNWDATDFIVMGMLLVGIGSAYVLLARLFRKTEYKLAVGAVLGLIFLLTWAELAVGIFGSPFAGS